MMKAEKSLEALMCVAFLEENEEILFVDVFLVLKGDDGTCKCIEKV